MMPESLSTLTAALAFAEAPRWHAGRLWFSDMYAQRVCSIGSNGDLRTELQLDDWPSGLGWLPDGRLLVVSMQQRCILRQDPEGLVLHADLSQLAPAHCNEIVVDALGRAYVGNFGFDVFSSTQPCTTNLILVHPDGSARVVADELMFPNGSVITPDGKTLIVAETMAHRLTAFDITADGSLSGRCVWADLDHLMPDGISLDAEGTLWVASPSTSEFVRVREGGEITDRIPSTTPAIACALGGEDGHTLFMLSGPTCAPEQALELRQSQIETMRVAVAGRY